MGNIGGAGGSRELKGWSYGSVKPALTASYFRSGTPRRTHSNIEKAPETPLSSFILLTRVLSFHRSRHVSSSSSLSISHTHKLVL